MIKPQLAAFLKRNKLDNIYLDNASKWYAGLIASIRAHHVSADKPVLLGINGCQGSGKSTLADYLSTMLTCEYQMNVAVLSLDDFYYSHQQRKNLAAHEHHLLQTRGVPGTHNLALAHATLTKLQNATSQSKPIALPRFDKKTDDPFPETQWPKISGPIDVIILEGWCLGVPAQDEDELLSPVNELESTKDKCGVWRRYINTQIREHYEALYKRIDLLIMLKAPSFDTVYQWRLEQEIKLSQTQKNRQTKDRIMDSSQIKAFIAYFQRLTEHGLKTLPPLCDWVFELDESRHIVSVDCPSLLKAANSPVIFTDLDGTLLDHYDYSFTQAEETLQKLRDDHIPVIPNTSKTYSELIQLRKALALDGPFIVENGAAIYIPIDYFPHQPLDTIKRGDFWVKSLVNTRNHWLSLLNKVPETFSGLFTGMSTMTVEEIADATGLDNEGAILAGQRQYGEPLLWHGNKEQKREFIQYLRDLGATILEGGRFIHVCGNSNKGIAMDWLMSQFARFNQEQSPCSIALGDGNNDVAMLEAAQRAAIIRSPVHEPPTLTLNKQVILSNKTGPAGWAEVIPQLLKTKERYHG